jgi:hypothetical protein
MSDLQILHAITEDIQRCLSGAELRRHPGLEALVAAARGALADLAQRLADCRRMLDAGHRSEALRRAAEPLPVREAAAVLRDADLDTWAAWCDRQGHGPMPPLDLSTLAALDNSARRERELEALLAAWRTACISRQAVADRLALARQLRERDPELHLIWDEQVRMLAKAHALDLAVRGRAARDRGDVEAIDRMLAEVDGASGLAARLRRYLGEIHLRRLVAAYALDDAAAGQTALAGFEAQVQREPDPTTDPGMALHWARGHRVACEADAERQVAEMERQQAEADAAAARQAAAEQADAERQTAIGRLRQAVAGDKLADLMAAEVEARALGCDLAGLQAAIDARCDELRLRLARQRQRTWALRCAGGLAVAGLVVWLVWFAIGVQRRQALAEEIDQLLQRQQPLAAEQRLEAFLRDHPTDRGREPVPELPRRVEESLRRQRAAEAAWDACYRLQAQLEPINRDPEAIAALVRSAPSDQHRQQAGQLGEERSAAFAQARQQRDQLAQQDLDGIANWLARLPDGQAEEDAAMAERLDRLRRIAGDGRLADAQRGSATGLIRRIGERIEADRRAQDWAKVARAAAGDFLEVLGRSGLAAALDRLTQTLNQQRGQPAADRLRVGLEHQRTAWLGLERWGATVPVRTGQDRPWGLIRSRNVANELARALAALGNEAPAPFVASEDQRRLLASFRVYVQRAVQATILAEANAATTTPLLSRLNDPLVKDLQWFKSGDSWWYTIASTRIGGPSSQSGGLMIWSVPILTDPAQLIDGNLPKLRCENRAPKLAPAPQQALGRLLRQKLRDPDWELTALVVIRDLARDAEIAPELLAWLIEGAVQTMDQQGWAAPGEDWQAFLRRFSEAAPVPPAAWRHGWLRSGNEASLAARERWQAVLAQCPRDLSSEIAALEAWRVRIEQTFAPRRTVGLLWDDGGGLRPVVAIGQRGMVEVVKDGGWVRVGRLDGSGSVADLALPDGLEPCTPLFLRLAPAE